MHKTRKEIGYTCRLNEIIRLLTTTAAAVSKISSTMRDVYGETHLLHVQMRTYLFFFLDCLTLESETDRLSRNVGNYQSTMR
jgi:hypothetical protein